MNIDKANVNELKSFIGSAINQIAAISNHFGLVREDDRLHTYVHEVATLVELARLSQVALLRLIILDSNEEATKTLWPHINPQVIGNWYAPFEGKEVDQLRAEFGFIMHQLAGSAHSAGQEFPDDVSTGLIQDIYPDLSQIYARYWRVVAEMLEMALEAQIMLAHVLRDENRYAYIDALPLD